MTTENPTRDESRNTANNQFLDSNNSENKTIVTSSTSNNRSMIPVKNVTGKIHEKRGTIRSFVINKTPFFVEPGSAVLVPYSYYNKIKNNRDSFGQLIWEECSSDEVDSNNNFRRRALEIDEETQVGLDNDFIETFMSLIADKESRDTALNILTTCESTITLNFLMKEIVAKSGLETKTRNTIVDKIINQINTIKQK